MRHHIPVRLWLVRLFVKPPLSHQFRDG